MRTVAEVVRWRASRHPDLPAVWFRGRTRTFAQLDTSSSALAGALASRLGLNAGDRVAVLDKNSDEYVELMFALSKLGAVMVPVNWRLKPSEVAQIVTDAQARLLIVGDEFRSSADHVGCQALGFAELPRGGSDPRRDDEAAIAWQLYTSGTTGVPKGAMLSNRSIFATLASLSLECPELVQGSGSLVTAPFYHIGGCGWALAGLLHGATEVMIRDVVPEELLETMVQQRVVTGLIVPSVLLMLTQLPGVHESDFTALRNLVYGASPISQALLEASLETFGCRFTQMYGLTETTGGVTALRHEDHEGARLMSCGRPMFAAEIRIVDQQDQEVDAGEVGELVFRGPSLMAGYWGRPEETAEAVRGGWLHTGDAGYKDPDGFIYIRDRIKDVIVSGAENVYPAEVEGVLAAHPAIADVAVIGVPDERWGETVKAIVVKRPGTNPTAGELIEWSGLRLAGYKRPRSVDFVESIPRNPTGKILKRELRERYWEGVVRRVH